MQQHAMMFVFCVADLFINLPQLMNK